AQVNAIILRYAVDEVNDLVVGEKTLQDGFYVLTVITVVLLTKEIVNVFVKFGQQLYGQKLRIYVSRDLSNVIIEKILTYRMSFFAKGDNETGKLQTRIDRGISSLSRLVQNFFINILPLFTSSIVALILMFNANFWVGLVGLAIVPIYVFIIYKQGKTLK